jgi:hypothetical protein
MPPLQKNPKKKKKAVRWRDQHQGELREVFIFEKQAFENMDDEGGERPHPMGGSWTELAKREHLNERDALRKKGGMSGEDGGGSGGSTSRGGRTRSLPPVTAIAWRFPPRLAQANLLPEVESSEVAVQNSRTRLSIERRYLHEAEIPVTPQEDYQVVSQPATNAGRMAMLEVITWVVGAAAEKRQTLAQVAAPPVPPPPPQPPQQQQQQRYQAPPIGGLLAVAPAPAPGVNPLDSLLRGVGQSSGTPNMLEALLAQPHLITAATAQLQQRSQHQQHTHPQQPSHLAPPQYQQQHQQQQPQATAQLLASLLLGNAGGGWAPPPPQGPPSMPMSSLLGPSAYNPPPNQQQQQQQNQQRQDQHRRR